jgi:hypothetical protein
LFSGNYPKSGAGMDRVDIFHPNPLVFVRVAIFLETFRSIPVSRPFESIPWALTSYTQ